MRIRLTGQLVVVVALAVSALTGISPAGATHRSAKIAAAETAITCAPIERNSVTRLYRAYFLREPDAGGLAYWVDILRTRRLELSGVSHHFAASAEFQARYSNLTDRQFVTLLYNNVMNRPPDQGGLDYWTFLLASNVVSRGRLMLSFSESPEFKERVGLWPAPPAAGDPRLLPWSVPVTMHPGRIAETTLVSNDVIALSYEFRPTMTLQAIFDYTVGQLQCPGWTVTRYDDDPAGNSMGIEVRGGNGLAMLFAIGLNPPPKGPGAIVVVAYP
jgi:hypothetical protein